MTVKLLHLTRNKGYVYLINAIGDFIPRPACASVCPIQGEKVFESGLSLFMQYSPRKKSQQKLQIFVKTHGFFTPSGEGSAKRRFTHNGCELNLANNKMGEEKRKLFAKIRGAGESALLVHIGVFLPT